MGRFIRLALFCTILLFSGCKRDPQTGEGRKYEKVTIVASVYPLADVAQEVGGDAVSVSWVVERGEAVEGLNPSSEARSRMRTANLLFASGLTEPWAVEGASDAYQHARLIRLDTLNGESEKPASLGYLWLDPLTVADGARELAKRIMLNRPDKEQMIRSRSEDYIKRLNEFTKSYQQKCYQAQNSRVLVLGNEYDPLLRRFGFTPILTVSVPATRLKDSDIHTIRDFASENRTRLLLISDDTPPLTIKDIEVRASVQTIRIDSLGSSGAKGRSDYIDLLKYDLEQLLQATSVR